MQESSDFARFRILMKYVYIPYGIKSLKSATKNPNPVLLTQSNDARWATGKLLAGDLLMCKQIKEGLPS